MVIPIHILFYDNLQLVKNLYGCNFTLNLVKKNDAKLP